MLRRSATPFLFLVLAGKLFPQTAADLEREADYILKCQYLSSSPSSDPAHGALNNVFGLPTWVSPRENALAILGLLRAAEVLKKPLYAQRAALAGGYLLRLQDPADGAWASQFDHDRVVDGSKPPNQTAEVMIGLYCLGRS